MVAFRKEGGGKLLLFVNWVEILEGKLPNLDIFGNRENLSFFMSL